MEDIECIKLRVDDFHPVVNVKCNSIDKWNISSVA